MGGHGRRGMLRVLCALLGAALTWAAPASANSIDIGDAQVTESAGAVSAIFTITREASLFSGETSVYFETQDGSATSPADYAAMSGTVAFGGAGLGGTYTQQIAVPIKADALDEIDETFRVMISGPEVNDGRGVATIVDDDRTPSLSVADPAAVSEGAAGAAAVFVVRLSSVSGRDVSVDYATANVSATAGQDYTARSGRLVIAAGTAQAPVDVPVSNDAADEPNETFDLRLSSPAGATIADGAATATILDDDAPATPPLPPAPPPPPPAVSLPSLTATPTGSKTGSPDGSTTGSSTTANSAAGTSLGVSSPRLKRPYRVLVTISCPQRSGRCNGLLTVFSVANIHSRLVALRKQRKLGRVKFNIQGGHSRTFSLAIGKSERVLLNRTGRMKVRAYAVTQDSSGRSGVRSVNGTLVSRTAHSGF